VSQLTELTHLHRRPAATRETGRRQRLRAAQRLVANNQWILLLFLTVVLALVAGSLNTRFWHPENIASIFQDVAVLGLVASGATILIISGNFDISVGAAMGLSGCITAMLIVNGWSEFPAVLVGILVCIGCSTFNGICSIIFKAPSFIISLATLGIYTGISLELTGGVIQNVFRNFTTLSGTIYLQIIPLIFLVTLAGYVGTHVVLSYTRLGRRAYAIGDNPRAAFLAGINVKRNIIYFFVLNGLLVGLGAWLLLARVGGALPTTGAGMELQAIGAVVIGGVPIMGGRGSVVGTFFGVLLMGTITNILNILNVSPYFQQMAYGGLIIAAVAISALRVRLGARE
jgi:ribose transport system permease protein